MADGKNLLRCLRVHLNRPVAHLAAHRVAHRPVAQITAVRMDRLLELLDPTGRHAVRAQMVVGTVHRAAAIAVDTTDIPVRHST